MKRIIAFTLAVMTAAAISVPASASGTETIVEAGDTDLDVNVGYTFEEDSTASAEKVYVVDLEYTFPTTVVYHESNTEYIWDADIGAYRTETTVQESVEFDGGFSITVTNRSNIDIRYEVTYTPNADSLFVNALDGDMVNATGVVQTIAAGQISTESGIQIENVEEATAVPDSLSFHSETCSGTLAISGIKSGATLSKEGGSNIALGSFRVAIAESLPSSN